MSARGFGSILWAGAVAGAALGFYLVSLSVASERAELEEVETKIALAQRDIRLLQTEIGTRGRLAQLERWNVKFIRLSAPTADQFVEGSFQLASMVAPRKKPAIEAPVVLAAAPVDHAIAQQPTLTGDADGPEAVRGASKSPSEMMHVAGYSVPDKALARPVAPRAAPSQPAAATKSARSAMADPPAPLSTDKSKAKGSAPAASAAGPSPRPQTKDSVTGR
ncbi:MAG TPA: hypothetical protein VFR36_06145, partial [Sphingomicrobium sp.]|nr:hypothetical protein [Sphingomicrobium sp.]